MKGQVKELLPALIVPLVLVIASAVFTGFSSNTASTFEEAIVNETIGTADGTAKDLETAYDCKEDSVTAVYNGTSKMTASTDYNVTYSPFDPCTISIGSHITTGTIKVCYTAYKGEGYTSFTKIREGTWGGYKLASLLPYIVIAMVVLGLLIGAFVIKGA